MYCMSLVPPAEKVCVRFLFPAGNRKLYSEQTFRFFQRVLTEMDEAKKSVEHYQALAKEANFDKFHDTNWTALTDATAKTEQMQKDIKIFLDQSLRTCDAIKHCRGFFDEHYSREVFFNRLMQEMFEQFTKVHGKDHDNQEMALLKQNVVENDSTSATVDWTNAQQFHMLTGHYPGHELPVRERDSLQKFFNQLESAGHKIFDKLHQKMITLKLANPYIVKFL